MHDMPDDTNLNDAEADGPAGPTGEGGFDLTPEGDEPSFDDIDFDAVGDRAGSDAPAGAAPTPDPYAADDGDEPIMFDGGLDEEAAPEGRVSELEQQNAELNDKLLRTTADYQNFIRRSHRELEQTRKQRVVELGRSLLNALDNFDRALEVDPETTSVEEVHRGVASIRDELVRSLDAFGLTKVVVEPGAEFDPNVHEALTQMPHDEIESGHVIQTLMPGYFVGETPVRPAQVAVAR